MAKSKEKNRQTIKVQTMRELMFASGGRCAMDDCGLPLTSPSGGWIGTVAHIVGAEEDGPRGNSSLTPLERAAFDNLLLMCATHGREVDAPDTGEAHFPVERLRSMKARHESMVTAAITVAIEQDQSGLPTATGAIDYRPRPSTAASTAAGLLESLGLADNPFTTKTVVDSLNGVRMDLQRLSQLALDTLSELLGVWQMERFDDSSCGYDFGDPSDRVRLSYQSVRNRVIKTDTFKRGMEELKTRRIVDEYIDDEEGAIEYLLDAAFPTGAARYPYVFWPAAAEFLYQGFGVEIKDWVRGLEFSIFDRLAPETRNVPWR